MRSDTKIGVRRAVGTLRNFSLHLEINGKLTTIFNHTGDIASAHFRSLYGA